MIKKILILILAFFLVGPPFSYGKVYIEINSASARKIPMAMEAFTDDELFISEVVMDDLAFSGIFNIVSEKGEKGDAPFWLSRGAEVFIKGKIIKEGDMVSMEAYLIDLSRGKSLLAKRYKGEKKDSRRLAHHFADDVVETLTGEKGLFKTKIAFVSREGGNKELYLMDYDGKNSRKVTANGSINLSPRWSPDGKKLLYTSFQGGRASIYVKGLATFDEKKLIDSEDMNTGGSWSPTGKEIVFSLSRDGDSDLFLTEYGSGSLRRITSGWGLDVSPEWSPDGEEISFVSDKGGNPNIYVVSRRGSGLRRITFDGKYNASPSWSSDGKNIAYSSLQKEGFRIYITDAEGKSTRQLTFGPGDDEEPSFSPDGQFIVFSSSAKGKKSLSIIRVSDGYVVDLKGTGAGDMSPSWSPYLNN